MTQVNLKIIKMIKKNKNIHAWQIANALNLCPQDVREHIKNIRQNSIKYLGNRHFIIAGYKGYQLSKDTRLIKAYVEKMHKTAKSMLWQVHQGWIVLKKVDEKDNLLRKETK